MSDVGGSISAIFQFIAEIFRRFIDFFSGIFGSIKPGEPDVPEDESAAA